ncbi:3'-5' exonuclease [Aquabacterium sp. OR-4]|uniref:3'-5' exonuclease n=1 Tax=Aquabacterium sp. OR-4 TaxID=2978127 RepID=UPI0021B2D24D|nr:3'-5' exonuclease [Aquabacterium sp. OR-4]MDT7836176.1 3'-5' exonuclease [Aquabacterium sp. OR-4]
MPRLGGAGGGWAAIKREWSQRQLADPQWAFLWQPPPAGEWVALDVLASGRDANRDRLLALAAVRGQGDRVLASQRLEVSLLDGAGVGDAAERAAMAGLLHFIGPRPLVGYYLDFDLALLDRALQPLLGVGLPNARHDVSAMFHDWKFRQLPPYQQQGAVTIDLRWASLQQALGLPERDSATPLDAAVLAGLAFVVLRHRLQRG